MKVSIDRHLHIYHLLTFEYLFVFLSSSMDFVALIHFYVTSPLTGASKGKMKAAKRKPSKGTSPVNSWYLYVHVEGTM